MSRSLNYLLDTNAVSEWVKPKPNLGLIGWMESVDEDRVFLSVVTLAELRYGVERLPMGARRGRLERWLDLELPVRFERRVLYVDEQISDTWGKIVARSESIGRPVGVMDAFLAATVEVHRLTLVTRNIAHFPQLTTVLNPWT